MKLSQKNKQHTKTTKSTKPATKKVKAPIRNMKRSMTAFAGAKSGNTQVFATGVVNRKQAGKTIPTPIAIEFNATTDFNTLSASQHRFISGSALVDTYTEALLLNEKGDAAKVTPMTIEPLAKDAKAVLTGPSFAWTKAQITANQVDGAVIDTTFDFAPTKINFKLVKKGKDAADSLEEAGELAVVERSQFYDFVRVQKTAHEKQALDLAV